MIKQLLKTSILGSALLFTGCGGGSGSGGSGGSGSVSAEDIASKDVLFIYSGLPSEACDAYQEAFTQLANTQATSNIVQDSIISANVANGTTCATYDRENDFGCVEYEYGYGSYTCAFGHDIIESGSIENEIVATSNTFEAALSAK